MDKKESQENCDQLAKYIDRKAREFRSLHFGYGLKEIKEFICILFKNAPPMKPKVSEAFVEERANRMEQMMMQSTRRKDREYFIRHEVLRDAGVEVK